MTSTTTPIDDDIDMDDSDLPICLNIQPPPGSLKSASKHVFAMPLTSPWLMYRYRKDVIEQSKEGEELTPLSRYTHQLFKSLSSELKEIIGMAATPEFAQTSHGNGCISVFVIGRPGRIPTPEAMYKLAQLFVQLNFVEDARWFPLYYS